MEENKYVRSKIYKIMADTTDEIYIGSTVQPLYQRFSVHKTYATKYLNGTYKNRCTSYDIINNHPTAKIILLEEFPCDTKEQLRAREQYHIDQHKEGGKLVNKLDAYVPIEVGREKKRQYLSKNSEYFKELRKQYYEKTKANRMEKYVCECGVELSRSSKSRHEKRRDHLEWLAKNDIPTII